MLAKWHPVLVWDSLSAFGEINVVAALLAETCVVETSLWYPMRSMVIARSFATKQSQTTHPTRQTSRFVFVVPCSVFLVSGFGVLCDLIAR
mgnify:CR=1 FL=1